MQTREHLRLSMPATDAVELVFNQRNGPITLRSQATEGHVHPYYELYVHIAGDISFAVNDTIYRMAHGDMILTRPNTYHHSICHNEGRLLHYCIFIHTTDSSLLATLEQLSEQCYLHYAEQTAEDALVLLEKMANVLATDSSGASFEQFALWYQLITILSKSVVQAAPPAQYPENLKHILNYIGKHYAEIRSIRELCDEFYISVATMERLFRRYLQITPYRYMEATRLATACRLLSRGVSVTSAAAQCGFPDPSHFIFLFRKRFDMTPKQYCKQFCQG